MDLGGRCAPRRPWPPQEFPLPPAVASLQEGPGEPPEVQLLCRLTREARFPGGNGCSGRGEGASPCVLRENPSASESWVMMPGSISREIQKCQARCEALEADRLALDKGWQENILEAYRLQTDAALLRKRVQLLQEEASSGALQPALEGDETRQLLQQKAALESELQQLENLQVHQVPPVPPERFMVFKGRTEEKAVEPLLDTLSVEPRILYPLAGGTALVTFEMPEVAQRILRLREHRVPLDECTSVRLKAESVELLMPGSVEVALERSPRQVLLSGMRFPSLSRGQLLDKLELFFSKRQNQGGEVEASQCLGGSGHVVLTFLEDEVAERLIQRGQFQVTLGKETSKVKVTPYLDGKISDLKLRPVVCPRTVLLSGIPEVLDEELMREALEIHFQKPSKGGGEVEAVAYVPPGQRAVAVFRREEGGAVSLSSAEKLA
ncbi:interferon-induced 35 kDa protein isoform X2 [Paroedura picta]|uniref:interferon-induced 35 kDa protein isoform X2 n=1 Tax=Paroedura picta TaxID=143630 RepID=UPI004056079A